MNALVVTLLLSHLLIAATSVPMILERVPPNRTYGFRTPATLGDERVWYAANAASGRWLLAATLISAAFAVAYLSHDRGALAPVVPLAFMTFAFLSAVAASFVSLRRILR